MNSSKAKPLWLERFDAQYGTAKRKDGGQEPLVFLTAHVRNAGIVQALPTMWIPPSQLDLLIQSLQDIRQAMQGQQSTPPHGQRH